MHLEVHLFLCEPQNLSHSCSIVASSLTVFQTNIFIENIRQQRRKNKQCFQEVQVKSNIVRRPVPISALICILSVPQYVHIYFAVLSVGSKLIVITEAPSPPSYS